MAKIELTNRHPRMEREARTIEAMIRIYCRDKHGSKHGELCAECLGLQEYAGLRLDKCPYQEEKTTCVKCPTHCYKPAMREQIRDVMRYAGPRMLLPHPGLTFMHLVVDSRRERPARVDRQKPAA
jgi:hypothetical protein